jgi:hypothetical protein
MAETNPYLQHLGYSSGALVGAGAGATDPLVGFMPRNVKADQVTRVLVRLDLLLFCYERSPRAPAGERDEPVHEATALGRVQEDPGGTQEAARVRADEGVLRDGE